METTTNKKSYSFKLIVRMIKFADDDRNNALDRRVMEQDLREQGVVDAEGQWVPTHPYYRRLLNLFS